MTSLKNPKHRHLFNDDFIHEPYWWQAYRPRIGELVDIPARTTVAIVGAGYAGLSTALELAKQGINCVVLEANELGYGASTRNAGGVSGGVNIGRRLSGRPIRYPKGEKEALLADASRSFSYLKNFIQEHDIQCNWEETGRFVGAWTPTHYQRQLSQVEYLNKYANSEVRMVSQEEQKSIINTDYYYGGQVIGRSATINPALYYKGLLDICSKQQALKLCSSARVTALKQSGQNWQLTTSRGNIEAKQVVIATNGYTTDVTTTLKKRIIPIESHSIVTEELDPEFLSNLLPGNMLVNDTLRIRSYYRLTPDKKRILFGGRGKFGNSDYITNSLVLYDLLTKRLPQLQGTKISYAWSGQTGFTFDSTPHIGERDGLYYILGCNGSGVAMMSFLGRQLALKIADSPDFSCSFDRPIPSHALYTGNPWFLTPIGNTFRVLDWIDRMKAKP